jgi:hypothetical protein
MQEVSQMHRILSVLLLLSYTCVAQGNCRVYDLKIGTTRDAVLSELKNRGCELKINVPDDGLEDDLVLPPGDDKYAYQEVMFEKGKLVAVWSYSPYFSSAEEAFSRLFEELVKHSTPDHPGDKAHDVLGQRSISASVFLQRPIDESFFRALVGFEVDNGSVILKMKKSKDGIVGVEVATVRNR